MTKETHVENEEDFVYPYKIRIFYIDNEHYYMNVQVGAVAKSLDDWLASEHKDGYQLNEISMIDENRALVILERDENLQLSFSADGTPYKIDVFDENGNNSIP